MPNHSSNNLMMMVEKKIPNGKDDSVSTAEQTLQHISNKKNRSHHNGQQGATAAPRDTASFGSGIKLHPHHKKTKR